MEISENEKKEILHQAELYLTISSLEKVSKSLGISRDKVRSNFTKLESIDPVLYEKVMDKLEENTTKGVSDQKIASRVLEVYRLIVDENKTIAQVADAINAGKDESEKVSVYTIARDIRNRMPKLHEIAPDVFTKEMLNKVFFVLSRHKGVTLDTEDFEEEEDLPLDFTPPRSVDVMKMLLRMYPSKEKRMKFLAKVALTFGLRLNALSDILDLNSEKLRKDIYFYNDPSLSYSLDFLFNHGFVDQNKATMRFYVYFSQLSQAFLKNDKESIINLLKKLNDAGALEFKKRHKKGDAILNKDIAQLLKYQLKYGFSIHYMADIFDIDYHNYVSRVYKFVENKPQLKSDFEYIADYYKNSRGRL